MGKRNRKIFFRVKNFKSLENVEIQISPLTFLFGPNGSGKSSLYKALKFLKANLFPLAAEELKFKLDEETDLLSYKDIVFNGDTAKRITMELELDPDIWKQIISKSAGVYDFEMENSFEKFNYDQEEKDSLPPEAIEPIHETTAYDVFDDHDDEKFEIRNAFGIEPEPDWEFHWKVYSMRPGGGTVTPLDDSNVEENDYWDMSFPFKLRIEFSNLNGSSIIEIIRIESKIENSFIEFYPSSGLKESNQKTISIFNNSELDGAFQLFYDNIRGLPFVGENYEGFEEILNSFIFHKIQGLKVWQESSYEQKKKIYNKIIYWYFLFYQYVPKFIASFLEIDHLPPLRNTPKEIYLLRDGKFNKEDYYGFPSFLDEHKRFRHFNNLIKGFELAERVQIRKEKSAGFLEYKPNSSKNFLNLKDASSGLLQILPVLYKCYINSQSFIEQPELHLHPKIQAKLAEYFVEQIQANESSDFPFSIIETHSEHLIRKIQVCIAKNKIEREDVAVYYFDKNLNTGKTKLKKMNIEENGFFSEPWPDGFFDDSFNLSMELLTAKRN